MPHVLKVAVAVSYPAVEQWEVGPNYTNSLSFVYYRSHNFNSINAKENFCQRYAYYNWIQLYIINHNGDPAMNKDYYSVNLRKYVENFIKTCRIDVIDIDDE